MLEAFRAMLVADAEGFGLVVVEALVNAGLGPAAAKIVDSLVAPLVKAAANKA